MNSLKDNVLGAITEGNATMRPRWQFIIEGIAVGFAMLILFLLAIYLLSFIVFTLRQTGLWFAPALGFQGIGIFFRGAPWILFFSALLLLGFLEFLIRRYAFAYRRPLLYSLLGTIFLVSLCGYAALPFHKPLFIAAHRNALPVAGPLYRMYLEPDLSGVHRGIVVTSTPDGFIIQDASGATSSILF
jgi:hypothetical protein